MGGSKQAFQTEETEDARAEVGKCKQVQVCGLWDGGVCGGRGCSRRGSAALRGRTGLWGQGHLKQESTMKLHFGKTSLSNRFAFLFLFEREDKNNVNKIYFVSLFLCFLHCHSNSAIM